MEEGTQPCRLNGKMLFCRVSYQEMGESSSLNSLDPLTGMVVGETNLELLVFVVLGVVVLALYPLPVMCVLACVFRFLVGL